MGMPKAFLIALSTSRLKVPGLVFGISAGGFRQPIASPLRLPRLRLAMTRKEVRYQCSYERVHLIAITTYQCYTQRYSEIGGL